MMRTKCLLIVCFTALFPALFYAQPLKLEYQTPAGATPNLFAQRPCASCIPMDMDGDKKDETVFFFNLPNGRRQYVLLNNGIQRKWPPDSVCCPDEVVFRGFYNFDGAGWSEGLFSTLLNNPSPDISVVISDTIIFDPLLPIATSFENNWRLLDARNTDGDAEPELVLYNTATKRMEFWGEGFTPGALSDTPPPVFSGNPAAGGDAGFDVQNMFNNARFAPSELFLEAGYQDYNGDKIPDIVYLETTDGCKMTILNGKNRQILWSGLLKLPPGVTSCAQLGVAGFFDFDGNGIKSAYISSAIPDSMLFARAFVFDPASNTLDNSLKPFFDAGGRPFAFRDVDKDGKTEIVVYNAAKREVAVLGVGSNASEHKPEPPQDYRSGPFSLKLRFESIPGARLPVTGTSTDDQRELDFNGDGATDLCIWKEMPNDTSIGGLTVVDVKSKSVLWEYLFSGSPLEKEPVRHFHGFFDADGDGQKELYLGNYTVITADKAIHRPFGENFTLQLIRDLDGDGFPEVLGRTSTGRIQVWSRTAATGAKDPGDAALSEFQCYPNPASGAFRVEYTLTQPEHVRIQLFDLQGRLLAVPQTRQYRTEGPHRLDVQLDTALPNGVYFVVVDAGGRRSGRTLAVQR